MWDNRLNSLFAQLNEEEYQSADELAGILGVSSKTVRNRLKELDEELRRVGAEIEVRYGAGYRLRVLSDSFYETLSVRMNQDQRNQYLSVPENRVRFLLEYLLNRREYIRIDDLSENFYVSRKTLTADLKALEKILKPYHLRLDRRPNRGIRIEGSEFDLRLCMANMMVRQDIAELAGLEETNGGGRIAGITRLVEETLEQQGVRISDVLFQNLIVHIYIALKRMEEENYVPMESVSLVDMTGSKAYRTAKVIGGRLQDMFQIEFEESEIQYMAIHLSGKQYLAEAEGNLVITQEISSLVTEMLERVYEAFKFDFREDLELRMTLSQHIVPLAIRMQYRMKIQNPMLKEIKERFSLAFTMAAHASTALVQAYQTVLGEEETGYLALAFALAIERQRTEISKKNILLVCSSGIGSARLLQYRYEELFGPYINHIETCNVGGLSQVDFSKFDYVFSTVPISMKIPIPIQEVKYFLGEGDIQKIKGFLTVGTECMIRQYFDPALFFSDMKAGSREEALKEITSRAKRERKLTESFYDAVIEREALAQTAFGNLVAMPHPNYTVSDETFVCVSILDRPILWGDVPVQVVFLVSIGGKKDKNLKLFYRIVAEHLLRSEYIKQLIEDKSFEGMMGQMQQIEIRVKREDK